MGENKKPSKVLLGVLIGAAAGSGLTYLMRPSAEAGDLAEAVADLAVTPSRITESESRTTLDAPRPRQAQSPERVPEAPTSEAGGPEEVANGELISARLSAYAEEGIRTGWSGKRSDAIPDPALAKGMARWRELVLEEPGYIGRRLASDQDELDAARSMGEAAALLTRIDQEGGPVPELVKDATAFEELFRPDTPASNVDATRIEWTPGGEPVADGSTLRFPAGVFHLRYLHAYWPEFPRDVTILGAGRDSTLIVGHITASSVVDNLKLQDLTFHNPSGGLATLSRGGTVLSLERVRLTGFDSGAGSSSAINTKSMAFLAKDCIFAGGYGRHPRTSQLFAVRTDALLARFDRCRFERMGMGLGRLRSGATVVLDHCVLVEVHEDPAARTLPPGVSLSGCTVTVAAGDPNDWNTTLARDLNELFPGWEERLGN